MSCILVQLLNYVVCIIFYAQLFRYLYDNHNSDECIQYNKCKHEHKVLVQLILHMQGFHMYNILALVSIVVMYAYL